MTKLEILIDFISTNAASLFSYAIQCDTEEKAKDLIGLLYSLGFRWENDDVTNAHFSNDGSITTKWQDKGRSTCYSITVDKIIFFGKKTFYENQGKEIITYDKFFENADDLNSSIDTDKLKENFKDEKIPVSSIISETQNLDKNINRGTIQIDEKECPQCKNIIKNNGSRFCMECGYQIPEDFFEIKEKSVDEFENSVVSVENDQKEYDKNDTEGSVDLKTNNQTKKQIIIISVMIIMLLLFIIVFKIIQINQDNNFSMFSSIWESACINTCKYFYKLF